MTDLSALPEADQQAIADTLLGFLQGFKDRNADLLKDVYADDAEWMNVFGTVKSGAAEIVDHLRELFAGEKFTHRELVGPPAATFQVVTPDVVVVTSHIIFRDRSESGGAVLNDDNCAQQVLRREAGGVWRIVSTMVKDEATRGASAATPAGP